MPASPLAPGPARQSPAHRSAPSIRDIIEFSVLAARVGQSGGIGVQHETIRPAARFATQIAAPLGGTFPTLLALVQIGSAAPAAQQPKSRAPDTAKKKWWG